MNKHSISEKSNDRIAPKVERPLSQKNKKPPKEENPILGGYLRILIPDFLGAGSATDFLICPRTLSHILRKSKPDSLDQSNRLL